MYPQLFKLAKISILAGAILFHSLYSLAQNPPTGGPNPPPEPDNSNIPLIIYPAAGVVLGAATYYTVRKLRKIPVHSHLESYLIRHQILPTADALHLLYSLNPALKNQSKVRSTHKIVAPEFPPLPGNQLNSTSQIQNALPANLKEQLSILKLNRTNFLNSGIPAQVSEEMVKNVTIAINHIEEAVSSYENKKQKNQVSSQLLEDLLGALNQTLKQSTNAGQLNSNDVLLIKSISENIIEIVIPLEDSKQGSGKQSMLYFQHRLEKGSDLPVSAHVRTVYADKNFSPEIPYAFAALADAEKTVFAPPDNDMLKSFAFAIYKIDSLHTAVTKGAEVEGKYIIQYVAPALKDFETSYHDLSPPASWAFATLPPAKYYLIIRDINGNKVSLNNPLIDMRDAFNNPQRKYYKEMIKVLLYITD